MTSRTQTIMLHRQDMATDSNIIHIVRIDQIMLKSVSHLPNLLMKNQAVPFSLSNLLRRSARSNEEEGPPLPIEPLELGTCCA